MNLSNPKNHEKLDWLPFYPKVKAKKLIYLCSGSAATVNQFYNKWRWPDAQKIPRMSYTFFDAIIASPNIKQKNKGLPLTLEPI